MGFMKGLRKFGNWWEISPNIPLQSLVDLQKKTSVWIAKKPQLLITIGDHKDINMQVYMVFICLIIWTPSEGNWALPCAWGMYLLPPTPSPREGTHTTHLQVQAQRGCSDPISRLCYFVHQSSPTGFHKTSDWALHLLNNGSSSRRNPGCPPAERRSRLCNPPHVLRLWEQSYFYLCDRGICSISCLLIWFTVSRSTSIIKKKSAKE